MIELLAYQYRLHIQLSAVLWCAYQYALLAQVITST